MNLFKVKNTWATHISKHPWGRFIRVRVTLRNQLHREPTEAEVEAAESNAGDKYQQVPPKQIISAYEKGEEVGIPFINVKFLNVSSLAYRPLVYGQ